MVHIRKPRFLMGSVWWDNYTLQLQRAATKHNEQREASNVPLMPVWHQAKDNRATWRSEKRTKIKNKKEI